MPTMKHSHRELDKLSVKECPIQSTALNRAPYNRIFIFKETGGEHYIDFISHPIVAGTLYIVPSFHFHYLSGDYSEKYLCMEIVTHSGYDGARYIVNTLRYRHEKAWHQGLQEPQQIYKQWLEGASHPLCLLQKEMPAGDVENNHDMKADVQLEYAEAFANSLANARITWQSLGEHAYTMPVHERTLRRACKSVYGYTPRYMQHYYLTLRAIHFLAQARYSVTEVLNKLGFSDNANFTRYMKAAVGYTPKDIRKRLEKKGIIIN